VKETVAEDWGNPQSSGGKMNRNESAGEKTGGNRQPQGLKGEDLFAKRTGQNLTQEGGELAK